MDRAAQKNRRCVMSVRKLLAVVAFGAGLLASSQTFASTITFDFTTGNQGYTGTGLSYVSDGVGLTVKPGRQVGTQALQTGVVGQIDGLGISMMVGSDTDPRIDSDGANEVAILEFDRPVQIDSFSFSEFRDPVADQNDSSLESYAYFADSDADGLPELELLNIVVFDLSRATRLLLDGRFFGVGAMSVDADFYLASVTVMALSVVPLPSAVLLFGAALAGLGWFTRHRKNAQA